MPFRLAALIALLFVPSGLLAQSDSPAKFQVYAGYSFLSNSFNGVPGSRQPLNGWDLSGDIAAWRALRFKVEAFGYRGSNLGAQQDGYFIMGGPEYSRRLGREVLSVEALLGDGSLNRYWGPGATPGETASVSALIAAGLDTPLTRRFSFHVDGGYLYENFFLIHDVVLLEPYRIPGLPSNFARISSGFLYRF